MANNYYDLIELPSGAHVPAPIAAKLVGEHELAKISVSRRRRDKLFFTCKAGNEDCDCGFYRCSCNDDSTIEESHRLKEAALKGMVAAQEHKKLRYISADVECAW